MPADNKHSQIAIIGGGITGVGIARDAALRGLSVKLFEKDILGSGASGHFHRILHSGARYALIDPQTAKDCSAENKVLRRIAPGALKTYGGIATALEEDADFADAFYQACQKAGVEITEIPVEKAVAKEPNINKQIKRAFSVPDGFIDGPKMLQLNRKSAISAITPAQFYSHHKITAIGTEGGRAKYVRVLDTQSNKESEEQFDFIINASGPWAKEIALLANIHIPITYDKGSMLVLDRQYTSHTLSRIRQTPSNGDIAANSPMGTILGTTSKIVTGPQADNVTQDELEELIKEGQKLVPSIDRSHITSSFAGVRPLYSEAVNDNSRSISRSFQILNHKDAGVKNFLSVVGGKFTIYRLMAERAMDEVCRELGVDPECQTANTPL